jgi:hypothetical protein
MLGVHKRTELHEAHDYRASQIVFYQVTAFPQGKQCWLATLAQPAWPFDCEHAWLRARESLAFEPNLCTVHTCAIALVHPFHLGHCHCSGSSVVVLGPLPCALMCTQPLSVFVSMCLA